MRNALILTLTLLGFSLPGATQSPVNLMIEVQVDSARQDSRSGVQAWAGSSGFGVQGTDQRQTRSGHSGQRLLVMDGGQAAIRVGSTRPLRLRQVQRGPWGEVVSEQIVYRSLGTGFKIRPRLMGERVAIDILSSTQESGATPSQPNQVNALELSTTVSGRLGEWIELGDNVETSDGAGESLQGQQIRLRVDLAQ